MKYEGEKMKKIIVLLTTVFALSLMANEGAGLYKKCATCHGVNAEKKALNKSNIIQGWSKEQLVTSLKGYNDGTYGGSMKGLMKMNLKGYSDEDIAKVSEYITTLK